MQIGPLNTQSMVWIQTVTVTKCLSYHKWKITLFYVILPIITEISSGNRVKWKEQGETTIEETMKHRLN